MSSDGGGSTATFSQTSVREYSNLSFDGGVNDFYTEFNEEAEPAAKRVRGNVNVINENIVSILDKLKLTDRNAMLIIAAVAQSLGRNLRSLVLNQS